MNILVKLGNYAFKCQIKLVSYLIFMNHTSIGRIRMIVSKFLKKQRKEKILRPTNLSYALIYLTIYILNILEEN